MELKELEEIVENMVLQLSYPGLDARSLNIALPMAATEAPTILYVQALGSESVNVRLIALRWFQNRVGAAKHHVKAIASLLENTDSWIRKEAIKAIEITKLSDAKVILKICELLKDDDQIVRVAAAKALGNLAKEMPNANERKSKSTDMDTLAETIINCLKEAADDPVQEVRHKAIKALRKIGAFSTS